MHDQSAFLHKRETAQDCHATNLCVLVQPGVHGHLVTGRTCKLHVSTRCCRRNMAECFVFLYIQSVMAKAPIIGHETTSMTEIFLETEARAHPLIEKVSRDTIC